MIEPIELLHAPMPNSYKAEWIVLFSCPPGEPPEAAGVLLVEKESNDLFVKLKTHVSTADEDIREFWRELESELQQRGQENGGAEVIQWLESLGSHVLRVSVRQTIIADDILTAIDKLYELSVERS